MKSKITYTNSIPTYSGKYENSLNAHGSLKSVLSRGVYKFISGVGFL